MQDQVSNLNHLMSESIKGSNGNHGAILSGSSGSGKNKHGAAFQLTPGKTQPIPKWTSKTMKYF